MANDQGIDYIKQQLSTGTNPQVLKKNMVAAGWPEADVDNMIKGVLNEKTAAVSPTVAADMITDDNMTAAAQPTKPGLKLFIPAAILLFIIIAIAGAYFTFFTPQKVLARMFTKNSSIKIFTYSFEFKGTIKESNLFAQPLTGLFPNNIAQNQPDKQVAGVNTQLVQTSQPSSQNSDQFSIKANGQADLTDTAKPKFTAILNATDQTNNDPIQSVVGELRYLDQNLYFKVDKIPNIEELNSMAGVQKLLGLWIKVDSQSLNGVTQSANSSTSNVTLTTDQLNKLATAYGKNGFFSTKQAVKFEKIDNVMTLHYVFDVDKTKLKNFLADYGKNVLAQPMSDSDLQEMQQSVDSMPALNGEVWVGTFDSYVHKLVMNFSTQAGSSIPIEGTYSLTVQLSQINQPIKFETPAPTIGLIDAETMLISPATNTATVDTDKDGLPDSFEQLWGTDPKKADTDGDGFTDGTQEVCKGYNPLGAGKITAEQQALPKPPTCS